MLASCSGDKTIRIWAREAGGGGWRCMGVLEHAHSRTVRSCCWSPSGRQLATAGFDRVTAIWEHAGGVWEQVAALEGHESEVKEVAWAPSGSLLATCSRDKSVWIWESQPGNEFEVVDVKHGHSQARGAGGGQGSTRGSCWQAGACSQGGRCAGAHHTATRGPHCAHVLQDVKTVRWHPSSELLVSASYDDSIKVWVESDDEWICAQTLAGALVLAACALGRGPGCVDAAEAHSLCGPLLRVQAPQTATPPRCGSSRSTPRGGAWCPAATTPRSRSGSVSRNRVGGRVGAWAGGKG